MRYENEKKKIIKISYQYQFYPYQIKQFIKRNIYDKGKVDDCDDILDIKYHVDEKGFLIFSHNKEKMVLHFYFTYPKERGKGNFKSFMESSQQFFSVISLGTQNPIMIRQVNKYGFKIERINRDTKEFIFKWDKLISV